MGVGIHFSAARLKYADVCVCGCAAAAAATTLYLSPSLFHSPSPEVSQVSAVASAMQSKRKTLKLNSLAKGKHVERKCSALPFDFYTVLATGTRTTTRELPHSPSSHKYQIQSPQKCSALPLHVCAFVCVALWQLASA